MRLRGRDSLGTPCLSGSTDLDTSFESRGHSPNFELSLYTAPLVSRPHFPSCPMLALRAGRVCPTTTTTRAFTTSTTAHRALPFFLDTLRAAAQETREHSKILSRDARHLRMIMFGKPGAGKGTLSARLVKKYDILSLSAGDLLRQHIMEGYGRVSMPVYQLSFNGLYAALK